MPGKDTRFHPSAVAAAGLALVLVVAAVVESRRQDRRLVPVEEGQDHLGGVFKSRRLLMGTEFQVTIWAPKEKSGMANEALNKVFDELAGIEKHISSWLPESETAEINRAAGREPVPVGHEMEQLLGRSLFWAERTGGAFDVTGGPLFALWEEARENGVLPAQEEVDRRRALTGFAHLRLEGGEVRLEKSGMQLGFGAIGKGFAADRAAALLEKMGVSNFLIDAGGDLLVKGRRGSRPWHVAVRDPRGDGVLAGLEAGDCAIASSGDYERYFMLEGQRFSHILDLRTGMPARHLSGVTVIAGNATDADALATALFVMKADEGMALVESLPEVEAILVDDAGKIILSSGLFLQDGRLKVDRF